MRSSTWIRAATTLALVAAPAAALAGDVRVPREHVTIQAALADAEPGDRIVVRGGRHAGVVVDRPGVTLDGRGATLVGVTRIAAHGVTLRGFRMDRYASVVVTADDAVVAGNRSRSGSPYNVAVQGGDRARIEGNVCGGGSFDVLRGRDAVIRSNRFRDVSVRVRDAGALVESNRVTELTVSAEGTVVRSNRCGGVTASGDRCRFEENRVNGSIEAEGDAVLASGNDLTGGWIRIDGDDASVSSNTVSDSPLGVAVVGNRADVSGNVIEVGSIVVFYDQSRMTNFAQCPGIVVESTAPGGTIAGNRVTHTTGTGMTLFVQGASVAGNVIHGAASVTSVTLAGSGNTFEGNEIVHADAGAGTGHGVDVHGDGNVIQDNRIADTSADGIVVSSGTGNAIVRNVVEGSLGCGIMVGAAAGTYVADCSVRDCDLGLMNLAMDTVVVRSQILGNTLADVLDLGAFSRFDGNTFETMSHDAWLVPHR